MLSLEEQQNVRRLLDSGTPENINLALEIQKGLGFDWAAVGVDADYFLYLLGADQKTDTQKAQRIAEKLGFNLDSIAKNARLDTFLIANNHERVGFWHIQGQVCINDANVEFLDSLKYFKKVSGLVFITTGLSFAKKISLPPNCQILNIRIQRGASIDLNQLDCWAELREFQAEGAYIQNIEKIVNAKNLRFLNLQHCENIRNLYWLSDIPSLYRVYINYCNIYRVANLSNLVNLQRLSLSHNKLETLANLGNLPNLEFLRANYNQIAGVSEQINATNFPKLKHLQLSNNHVRTLPKSWKLPHLETLNLSNNFLSILPKELDLPKLEELYVQNNKIENLEIISGCAALKRLNYRLNPIQKIPALANFNHLRTIHGEAVRGLSLSQTDEDWFFALPLALQNTLFKNAFASASKKIVYYKELLQIVPIIQLSKQKLTTLSGLETAQNCQRLDMPNNQIQDLSPLSGLGKLTHLNCSKNLIQDFSPIQNLPIVRLNCANNPVKDYRFLQKMPHLQTLDCSKTGLSILSFLKYCPHIQQVICRKNPVFILPKQTIPTLISLEISTHIHKLSTKEIHRFRRLNPQCTLKFS